MIVKTGDEFVTVINDVGVPVSVQSYELQFEDARQCALNGMWNRFYDIANSIAEQKAEVKRIVQEELDEHEAQVQTLTDTVNIMRGLIADGLVDPEELGLSETPEVVIDEHDLSQWNGSPIFYDSEVEARDQASKSMGFWKFHDFGTGGALQSKYRYATVPTSFGPTAPDGYDWVCLKRS